MILLVNLVYVPVTFRAQPEDHVWILVIGVMLFSFFGAASPAGHLFNFTSPEPLISLCSYVGFHALIGAQFAVFLPSHLPKTIITVKYTENTINTKAGECATKPRLHNGFHLEWMEVER